MNRNDYQKAQIINIIKRGQQLVIQAKKLGAEVDMAEELIKEARYALKMGNNEKAVEYAKKCMIEVIQSKRELDRENLLKDGAMENLTKSELRQKCQELGLDSVGLKEELISRLKDHLDKTSKEEKEKGSPGEKPVKKEKVREKKKTQAETGKWSPENDAENMIDGLSYIVEEKRADKIFSIYHELVKGDKKGFALSRTNPRILSKTYQLDTDEFLWLTDRDVGEGIKCVPPSLESIIYYIEEFMDNNNNGIIMLDGLEYLIGNNTFNPVVRFLRRLVDRVSTTDCILLISLAPDTLDPSQVTLLEKDFYPLKYI